MSNKLQRALLSTLIAASVAVLASPPAEARRNTPPTTSQPGYVPPYGESPELEAEPDPYAAPVEPNTSPVTPTVVPVELSPAIPDPGLDPSGGGNDLSPAPADAPQVLSDSEQQPAKGGVSGVFANTGAETLPLARAGLAALTLGMGLVMFSRRRRQAAAPA